MKIEIELPDELVKGLNKLAQNLGFDNVEDCILFILSEYIIENSDYNKKEMKEKLKDLGYF